MGLNPGDRLPSCRAWSIALGVPSSAVHRGLMLLQQKGIVFSRTRSGWFWGAKDAQEATPIAPSHTRSRPSAHFAPEVLFPLLPVPNTPEHPDGMESWSTKIFYSIAQKLGEKDIRFSLLHDPQKLESSDLPEMTVRQIEAMERPPLGVILFSSHGIESFLDWLDKRGIPYLTIGPVSCAQTENFVGTNFNLMGRMAGLAMSACEFERVLYLYSDFRLMPTQRQLFEGFCSGFAESTGRLPAALQFGFIADSPQEFGYRAMRDYLDRHHQPPEAVFACGDYVAIGAIKLLAERGISCPQDVSVIGTTGLEVSGIVRPGLTTIKQPMEQIGALAVEKLLQMRRSLTQKFPGIFLQPELIFRESFVSTPDLLKTLRESFPGLRITDESTGATMAAAGGNSTDVALAPVSVP